MTHNSTRPLIAVAKAITRVIMIIRMYKTDGIIRCFFFIAFKWPFGVDKKQLAAIFSIWQMENIIANDFTSNPEKTNTKVMIHDRRNPVIEQTKNPMILC